MKSVVAKLRKVGRMATNWFVHEDYGEKVEQYRHHDVEFVYFTNNFGSSATEKLESPTDKPLLLLRTEINRRTI